MMIGYIHSLESFSTVDGPGIRYVVFLQGCSLRCLYCHNPDTWDRSGGTPMTAEEILERYRQNRAFYSKGGITVSGGEPLMQTAFVNELFTLAKKEHIHTCLDTSAGTYQPGSEAYQNRIDRLLSVTDLVLLDIKHIDDASHRRLTGISNRRVLDFAHRVSERGVPLWIRHVVVPGYTDDEKSLRALGRFAASLPTVQAIDVLPYHTLGLEKYRNLQKEYPLEGVQALSPRALRKAKKAVLLGVRDVRRYRHRM